LTFVQIICSIISTNLGAPVTGGPHGATAKLSAGHRWPPWHSTC